MIGFSIRNNLSRLPKSMKKQIQCILLWTLMMACNRDHPAPVATDSILTLPTDAKPVTKTNSQKVYVHYMPWFEDPTTSGNGRWGQHWTMATQNPDIVLADGRRQIASYFYPMIGPYASSDRDVIDYHLLLMKYAGIDGVIVAWFGTHNVYDYPLIKRNTDALFNRVPNAGLSFAICYGDGILANVKNIAGIDYVPAATLDIDYLNSNYFKYSHYSTIDNQPLLLCWGPTLMKTVTEWEQAFSKLRAQPKFISLEYHGDAAGSVGSGEFAWVESDNLSHLQNFYQHRAPMLSTTFAGAYPGFKDFYSPGGSGNTLFVIDHNGTSTLQSTLDLAKNSGSSYLQLITWNDFGEGTMLEPTLDFNFTFLETVQQYTGVAYSKIELQLIYRWYTLRKKYKGNSAVELQLTQAYTSLVSLDVVNATNIISSIQ